MNPTPWRTIRVFVSSTFRDMQAERDHLVRFVFPRLREELLKRRMHLVDVDLRWGVTSEQDALEVCREIIDECRPRFICILGGRYGWVAPGKEHSITADEVRYGVGDCDGQVYLVALENLVPSPSVLTAWHSPHDNTHAFGCLHCRAWSEISEPTLGTELPCPNCGKPMKLNPFVIEADWRPVAEAWRGSG